MENLVKGLETAQTACAKRLKSLLTLENYESMIAYYFPLIYGYNVEFCKNLFTRWKDPKLQESVHTLKGFRFGNHETLIANTTLEEKVLEILHSIYPNMIYEWDHISTTSDMYVFTIMKENEELSEDDDEEPSEKPREDRSEKVPLKVPVVPMDHEFMMERLVSIVNTERLACIDKFKEIMTEENMQELFEEYFHRIHGYHVMVNEMIDDLQDNQICFNIGNDDSWGIDEKSPTDKIVELLKMIYPNMNLKSLAYRYCNETEQYYHTYTTDELPFLDSQNKDQD